LCLPRAATARFPTFDTFPDIRATIHEKALIRLPITIIVNAVAGLGDTTNTTLALTPLPAGAKLNSLTADTFITTTASGKVLIGLSVTIIVNSIAGLGSSLAGSHKMIQFIFKGTTNVIHLSVRKIPWPTVVIRHYI